jgi:hypothetical protein
VSKKNAGNGSLVVQMAMPSMLPGHGTNLGRWRDSQGDPGNFLILGGVSIDRLRHAANHW